jgi:hypothetical protein
MTKTNSHKITTNSKILIQLQIRLDLLYKIITANHSFSKQSKTIIESSSKSN